MPCQHHLSCRYRFRILSFHIFITPPLIRLFLYTHEVSHVLGVHPSSFFFRKDHLAFFLYGSYPPLQDDPSSCLPRMHPSSFFLYGSYPPLQDDPSSYFLRKGPSSFFLYGSYPPLQDDPSSYFPYTSPSG
jgi:hypothetical protein